MEKTEKNGLELFQEWLKEDPRKQGELAKEIGTSDGVFSLWKTGKRQPIRMARVAIENLSGGAVPRHIPWHDPQGEKEL